MADVAVLGIRHHGPGSARSVLAALEQLQPDAVVIEGPPELDALIGYARDPDLVPPVAALVHIAEEPRVASFYPFAAFSPEWVAMGWALRHDRVVRFADLPATNALALTRQRREAAEKEDEHEQPTSTPRIDPIGQLAGAAGYDDPERWWEDAVEHRENPLAAFAAIGHAVALLRTDASGALIHQPGDQDNARREAAMRKVLRATIKDGHDSIAVVCGAFHAPALHPDAFPTISADTATLKGLPRVKVAATWAPWTAQRLARASGYGAGVSSPGWYAHCFATPPDAVITTWMVRVAHSLRRQDLDAPSANVIDAVRLAEGLAAIRGRPLAGLTECTDAALAVLCNGNDVPLRVIHDELVVGHELGRVPSDTPQVPLAKDLERQSRSARLKRMAEEKTVTVDLRTDAGLAKSILLHRLQVLGIRWGRLVDAGPSTGTFKEAWLLVWQPELAVAVIEAGIWGTTVHAAAEARAIAQTTEAATLTHLSQVLSDCIPAELPGATNAVVAAIEQQSAALHDTVSLMEAVDPLARSCRYGDVRQFDTTELRAVVRAIILRVSAGLRPAMLSLDDDAAARARTAIEGVHRAISLIEQGDGDVRPAWLRALADVASDEHVHGLVAGRVLRLLLDQHRVTDEHARGRLGRELSRAREPQHAAAFLDGFLDGDASLLLLDQDLLDLVDEWVHVSPAEVFDDLLPLLRRTFSRYAPAERRAIGTRLRHGSTRQEVADDVDDVLARDAVLHVLSLVGAAAPGAEPGRSAPRAQVSRDA